MEKEDEWITLEYRDMEKLLEKYNKEMPGIAVKLMRAVNNRAKSDIRAAYRSRKYHAHKQQTWGDSGYSKNLKSFADKDFSAKIMIAKNAFYYRYLEYGAEKPAGFAFHYKGTLYRMKNGWKIDSDPVLHTIADTYWKTTRASTIMEKQFQKELAKRDAQNK